MFFYFVQILYTYFLIHEKPILSLILTKAILILPFFVSIDEDFSVHSNLGYGGSLASDCFQKNALSISEALAVRSSDFTKAFLSKCLR